MDLSPSEDVQRAIRRSSAGRIAGALGLLLLLSSPYTLFVSSGSVWLAGAKALLGGAGVLLFVLTRVGTQRSPAARHARVFVLSEVLRVVALLGALSLVNFVAAKKNHAWDFTRRRIFTLAPQTLTLLHGLKESVHAECFILSTSSAHESAYELLSRYQREAPDRFSFTFRDLRKSPDLAEKYGVREGQTTIVLTGAAMGDAVRTSIDLPAGQELSEQTLTNALARLVSPGERKVYVLSGHGEWPLESSGEDAPSLTEFGKSLRQDGYAPESLNLLGKNEVPPDAALLIIPGARTPYAPTEEKALRSYLDGGGHLLLFVEAAADVGLKDLLAAYGVEVDPGMVADDVSNAEGPYVLVTNFYSDHELARVFKRLQLNLQLPTVRGLTVLREGLAEGVPAVPVVLSSPNAWEQTTLTSQPTRDQASKSGSIPLVVASTRRVSGGTSSGAAEARMVVFGDSDLLVDANWRRESYRNLVLNSAAWATNQLEKITIRPVDRDLSSLDLDEATMGKVRFVSTDLLPLSLLGFGIAMWIGRRNR